MAFKLGVGTGEALNEHILGDRWPPADTRLEMLEEAVAVIRRLWKGGRSDHQGEHYTVENARIYDLPDEPPQILVSGFGDKATRACRLASATATARPIPDPDTDRAFRRASGGRRACRPERRSVTPSDEAEARRDGASALAQRAAAG